MAVSSPFPLDVLEFNLDNRRSCIEVHDEEMEYICSCLSNYYEDVIHAIDIGLSHSAVSHYSYNLVLILAKGLTSLVIYEYIRGAYLLEEDYDNVYKTWKSVHDSVDEIIPLLDNLEKENYFGEDINTDDFLSDILPPHCERSKGYEKLLNLHRRVSLRTGNSLVCTLRCYLRYMEQWLTDLKNGLYKDIEEDYERVFWANYKLYKQEYWPKDGKNFRNQVLSSKPRFEDFNAEYLKRCLWEERTDFFHTSPGQLWRDHSSDKKELYFGAKDIKMNESQWRYFFKCICRVEEYEKWIDELENPVVEGKEYPESDWDKIFKDAIDVKKVKIALQKLLPKKISITTWYIIYKIFVEIDWLQDSISIHFISWVKDVYGWQYKTEDFKNSVNPELKQQHSLDWNTRTMTSAKIAKDNIDFAESVRKEFVIEMNGKTVKEDNKYYFKKPELYISHPIRT